MEKNSDSSSTLNFCCFFQGFLFHKDEFWEKIRGFLTSQKYWNNSSVVKTENAFWRREENEKSKLTLAIPSTSTRWSKAVSLWLSPFPTRWSGFQKNTVLLLIFLYLLSYKFLQYRLSQLCRECCFQKLQERKVLRWERTGEVAQQLRAMAALPQDLGSILPSTWWLTKTYNSFSKGYDTLFLPLGAPGL